MSKQLKKVLLLSALSLWLAGGRPAGSAPVEQQRALFVRAEQALNQGRPAEARQLFAALGGYPLQPYLLFRILSETPGTEGDIPAFLERYGQTRHASALRKKWLDFLAQREAWADYIRFYQNAEDIQAQCHYYWALHQSGRDREAFAGAAKLWETGEPRPAACDRLFAVWQASPEFTPDHLWKRLGLALSKNHMGLASYLRTLVPDRNRKVVDLWFNVHENPRQVEQCTGWSRDERVFGWIFAHGIERLASQDPLRAQNLWNLRRNDFALAKDDQARLDRQLALALATQGYPQATAYLGALPEDMEDSQIRTWRVRAALARQDWPGVLAALERLAGAEKQQTVWRYWHARALESLGDINGAADFFRPLAEERDFYGFIAADRLQRHYPLSFTSPPIPETELQRLADSEPIRMVQEFRALNRIGEAQREWLHALRSLPPRDLAVAAKLAQQWGWDRLAILTLAKADNRDDLALRFPLAYAEPIAKQAREQRLDPAVVYGLIRRESAFAPDARSSAGALGLMQLLPGTGAQVARLLGELWRSERSLLEPETNVRYGSAYFRGLLDRFGGHLALAMAAYNAGPGRVDRWLPANQPLPADVWIETLPFGETRQYVSAVLSYTAIYRERLGQPFARISGFLTDIAPSPKAVSKPDRPAPVRFCR